MSQTPPNFRTALGWGMGRRGVKGAYADAAAGPGGLTLRGEKGGELQIPLANIAKMRVGFTESKNGIDYETYLWLNGDPKPIFLAPLGHGEHQAYRANIRVLASAMGKAGRPVVTGTSIFNALLAPALFGVLFAAALFVAFFALQNLQWWQPIAVAGVPGALFAVFVWQTIYRFWPKPAAGIADLDNQLPPPE